MESGNEELLQKVEKALNQLSEEERKIMWFDIDNNYEERDAILHQKGCDTQVQKFRYIQRLRNKVKEIVESYND